MRTPELIREYVSLLLNEDDAGDLMGGATDAYPYGVSYGSGQDLYKIFVEPFADVFKVAAGKGKELGARAQTLGRTVFDTIASTLIPSLSANYERTFKEEKQRIDALKREYKPVYDRVWEAFNHDDVRLLAFMYSPVTTGGYLSWFGGKGALQSAIGALNVVSGGMLDGIAKSLQGTARKPAIRGGSTEDDMGESIVREQSSTSQVDAAVRRAMDSPAAIKMRSDAQKVVQGTLRNVTAQAEQVLKAASLDQLPGFKREASVEFDRIPRSDRQELESKALEVAKDSAREFYVKSLQAQLDRALRDGVPEDASYVKDYRATIRRIEEMR